MNKGRKKMPPLEGQHGLSDKLLSQYPLNEETRDGCNVCAREVLHEDKLHGPPWTEGERPEFLGKDAVLKRVGLEYQRTYRAWQDLAKKYGKYPSVQEVKSLRESIADIPEKLKSELKASFQVSQPEPPQEKGPGSGLERSFPLTLESRKKHIEKATVLKKDEKRTALENVRKKQEELRKLKDEYSKLSKQIHCKQKDKKAEYERKKEEYLEKLSKEKDLDIRILRRRGDEIYRTYLQESNLAKETLQKKAAERDRAIQKVMEERRARTLNPAAGDRRPSLKTESWERLKVEEVFREAQDALSEDSMRYMSSAFLSRTTILAHEQSSLSLKTQEHTPKPQLVVKKKSKRSTYSRKKNYSIGLKAQTKNRGGSVKSINIRKKSIKKSKSEESSQHFRSTVIETYPSCEELKAEPCGLNWDLKEASRRAHLFPPRSLGQQTDGKPPLDFDDRVSINPKTVYFQNFFPAETKTALVKIFNTSLNKIYIQFKEVVLNPKLDSKMIQVWPPDMVKLWPGNCKTFELNFSMVVWPEMEEFSGQAWFMTRSPKNYKDVRYVTVNIECSRAKADPVILEKEINFVEGDDCINCPQTKYLTIENRGVMECRVYIRRYFISQESTTSLSRRLTQFDTSDRLLTPTRKGSKYVKRRSSRISQSQINASYIIEYLIDNAVSPFRIFLTRGRVLKSLTRTSVPVRFLPQLLQDFSAVHTLKLEFQANYGLEKEETVHLFGSGATPALDVLPEVMDMDNLVMGTRGNQFVFTVKNISSKFHNVKCKLPKILAKHFMLEPASTLLRPQAEAQFVIRSNVGWSFFEDAEEYYSELSSVLEFEIDVIPENHLPTRLVVLGTVAHPLALSIVPDLLEFGSVLTTETACLDFSLINHSMIEQEVAFLNVPEWGLIMPGYGVVKIGPCQSMKLQFQYSPTYVQAGGPGKEAQHNFEIKCSTARMLSTLNRPKPFPVIEKIEPKDLYDEMTVIEMAPEKLHPKTYKKSKSIDENMFAILFDSPSQQKVEESAEEEEGESEFGISFLDEDLADFDVENVQTPVSKKRRLTQKKLTTSSLRSLSSISRRLTSHHSSRSQSLRQLSRTHSNLRQSSRRRTRSKSNTSVRSSGPKPPVIASQLSWCKENLGDIDRPYVILRGKAEVCDPFCELSHARVIFPATPVTSFSIVPIYLSCPSDIKRRIENCGAALGPEDDPRPRVSAHFEFSSTMECLQIEPASGTVLHGEKIKINLIFKPTISEKKLQKALNSDKKKSVKLKRFTTLKQSQLYNDEMASYNINKLDLLRGVKNEVLRILVKCLLEVTLEDTPHVKRTETLHCLACCPVVRPDFVIWTSVKQLVPRLEFPVTAAGMKSRITLDILNNTWENIHLRKTVVDISGTFYTTLVPSETSSLPHNFNKGVVLPPEAYVRFDIVYAPHKTGSHIGSIQFSARNTVVECKLSGSAVMPVYNIYPTFKLLKLESEKYKGEEIVKVENKGNTSLVFYVNSCFEREIYDSAFMTPSILDYSKQVQKSINRLQEMDFTIKYLINNYSVESHKYCRISVEPKKLFLKPGGNGEFKISFKPPTHVKASMSVNDEELMDSEEAGPEEYVKRVKITLGTSNVVADWTILGIVSQRLNENIKRKSKLVEIISDKYQDKG